MKLLELHFSNAISFIYKYSNSSYIFVTLFHLAVNTQKHLTRPLNPWYICALHFQCKFNIFLNICSTVIEFNAFVNDFSDINSF